jgi:hypothetical protein
LHITFRFSDLGMRVETADALPIGKQQHVLVTYDGGMRAAGVHMYVDGREMPLKVLFDYAIWPIGTKEPLRIKSGGGMRWKGDVEDVRIFNRALPADEAAVVSIELALKARFSTSEGLFSVQAQLTDNSWLITRECQLTGGFAFFMWFRKSQFLLTLGGYHPSFCPSTRSSHASDIAGTSSASSRSRARRTSRSPTPP